MQTVRAADTNEVVKLIFRESDNDRKVSARGAWACRRAAPAPPGTEDPLLLQVMLQLEKKLFDYFNQDVFRDDNGTAVSLLREALHPGTRPPHPRPLPPGSPALPPAVTARDLLTSSHPGAFSTETLPGTW